MTPWTSVDTCWNFGETWIDHLQGKRTLVAVYQIAWHHITKDDTLNPSVILSLNSNLLPGRRGFKFTVRLNAFMTIQFMEIGSMWGTKGVYSAPRMAACEKLKSPYSSTKLAVSRVKSLVQCTVGERKWGVTGPYSAPRPVLRCKYIYHHKNLTSQAFFR